jgi:hypothetical protein
MTTDPTPSLADRCSLTLGEMRARLAAQGGRKGPTAMLLAVIVRFLETLAALVADFEAGRLAAPAPGNDAAGGAGRSGPKPPLTLPLRGPLPLPQGERAICDTMGALSETHADADAGCAYGGADGPRVGFGGKPCHAGAAGRESPGLRCGPRSRAAASPRLQDCSSQVAACHRGSSRNMVPIQKTEFRARGLCMFRLLRYRNNVCQPPNL